jgi:succinate---hydroxymethylglutarate CoA-transferase
MICILEQATGWLQPCVRESNQRGDAMSGSGLLEGIRVLEFGQIAAGPFAGSLLADLGADVVKVESPSGGDGMRAWPPIARGADGEPYSENFASVNRNKRSIALDLKDETDLDRIRCLCASADVLLENFRPGVLDRHGLGYARLRATHRGIIYCSISGYGQSGPYARHGAFDVTVQAMSGLMSVTGEAHGGPVKCGVPVGDFCAGLYAVYTITAALLQRQRTGEGTRIDCSMLGSLLGISALQTSEFFGTGKPAGRLGSSHPRNAPYQAFRAVDDHFVIAAGNDKLWHEVCDAVGRPGLGDDPRYATQQLRAENQAELAATLEAVFQTRPAREWLDEMNRRGVPASPINTFADVLSDPQVEHMGMVTNLTLPNGVETRTTGFPVAIDGFDFRIRHAPPRLGEHTEEVLAEWTQQPR